MPRRWLVKTTPALLPIEDLRARRVLTWEGVTQPSSLAHLSAMRRGEDVMIYHTAHVRAAVAIARVRKGAYPDPADDAGTLSVVDLTVVERLARPVRLAELREEPTLEGWDLLRWPRLHVMPVPAIAWRKILSLARR